MPIFVDGGFTSWAWDQLTGAYEWLTGQQDPNIPDNGFKITTNSNVASLPVVYGRAKLGGNRVLPWTKTGDEGEYLHTVIALCEGSIQAVDNIYIDDTLITDDRFTGLVRANIHLGSDSQAADADAVAEIPEWTTAHRLQGTAYVYLRLTYNRDAFSGVPGNIQFEIRGRNTIYDPRDASTGYTTNAALCVRDYLTDTRYGKGLAVTDIDEESFKTAANVCDEQITPYVGAGSTINRFECDGVVDTGNTLFDNVKSLLANCRAGLPQINGQYTIVIDGTTTPEADGIDEDDILGDIRLLGKKASKQYNRVTARYLHPENNWQPDFAIHDNPTLRADDNGLLIETEIRLPFCINPYRAERLCETVVKDSRQGLEVSFLSTLKPWRKKTYDVIPVSYASWGWSGKNFRIKHMALQSSGMVAVTLREYEASVYDEDVPPEWLPPADTLLPDPFFVEPPTGLTLDSGDDALFVKQKDGTVVSRIHVTWTPSTDIFVMRYLVQYKRNADSEWITAGNAYGKAATELYIWEVEDGVAYDVQVQAINSNEVGSAVIQQLNHTVIGKTAPPPEPDTFLIQTHADGTRQFEWGLNTVPADVRVGGGWKLRYRLGTGQTWDNMYDLHNGLLIASPFETNQLAAGTYTFAVKTVDSSGNESTVAKYIEATLPDPRLKAAILVKDFRADSWSGTLTDCFVHANGIWSKGNMIYGPPTKWTASNVVVADDLERPTTYNNYYYKATVAGTTDGATEPTWPTTIGSTVADGTVTWRCEGHVLPYPWSTNSGGAWNPHPFDTIIFEADYIDVGAITTFTPLVSALANGTLTIEERHKDLSGDPWSSYAVPSGSISARYIQVRFTVVRLTGIPNITTAQIILDGDPVIEEIPDLDTSGVSSPAGVFRAPITKSYSVITIAKIVAIQNVGAGWTAELIDKDPTLGPRFKVYNGSSTLADATVDIEIKGLP